MRSMPRVFLPNFDFEHQLAEPSRAEFGGAVRQINAELAGVWLSVAEPGDAVWSPAGKPIFDDYFEAWSGCPVAPSKIRWITDDSQLVRGDELCPWGWSEQVVKLGRIRGLTCPAPPIDAVREVNSRRFSFELETEWRVGLDGFAWVTSLDQLRNVLAGATRFCHGWLVKALLGMSGREQLVGRGADLSPPMLGWLTQRFERDGAVIFEPRLDRIAEAGLQWQIPRHGEPVFVGVAPMIDPPNASGGYFGSRIDPPEFADSRWHDAVEVSSRVASEVQRRGYFGPLGIDAMLYRDDGGHTRLRPIQDVNARWTMGRLAIELRRFLKPHEFGSWLHLNWNVTEPAAARVRIAVARRSLPDGTRLLWTGPIEIGGRVPRKQTVLLAAPTADLRAAAEATLIEIVAGDG
jgi:hypothetical protein